MSAEAKPWRWWVGATPTQVTPATGRGPPGTVISRAKLPHVPTSCAPS